MSEFDHLPDNVRETLEARQKEVDESNAKMDELREQGDEQVFLTEENWDEHVANVPGIFGDVDTTAGAGASGQDVVAANNEEATMNVAEATVAAERGDEDAQDLSVDEARRQDEPTAIPEDKVDEVGRQEDEGNSQESAKDAATATAGNTPADSPLDSGDGANEEGDDKKKSSRRGSKK